MTSDDERPDGLDSLNDPGEERVPIYSYPAKYRWLFTTCLVIGTLAAWGFRVWVELYRDTSDTWHATLDAILNALPMSSFTGVMVGIITVEVYIVVGELLQMRRKKREAEHEAELKEARDRADKAEARLKESETENAKLRQERDRNDSRQ